MLSRAFSRMAVPNEDLAEVACKLPVNILLCARQLHRLSKVKCCRRSETLHGLLKQAYSPTCRFM